MADRPDTTIPEEARRAAAEAVHGGAAYGAAAKRKADAALAAAVPLILAAELEGIADGLNLKATERYQIGEDNGDECDGECEMSGCHAIAASGAYLITEHRLRRRAAELRGGTQ